MKPEVKRSFFVVKGRGDGKWQFGRTRLIGRIIINWFLNI
jgi:hypothetical protein